MTTPKRNQKQNTKSKKEVSITQQSIYSGPLPDPNSLAMYEDISPGFANRLIVMAEKEQKERILLNNKIIDIEAEMIKQDTSIIKRGQWFAFFSVLLIVLLSSYGFYLGYSKETAQISIGVIVALAGVFAVTKFTHKKGK